MKKDKLKIYLIELGLISFLLLTIFFSNIFTRPIIAIILLVFMVISVRLIKNNQTTDINNKKVTFFMGVAGILYVGILYFLGIFQGFYNTTVKFSLSTIINFILPYIVIILSIETIRKKILLKEVKRNNLIMLIITVFLDIVVTTNINTAKTLKDYFIIIGIIAFSSIVNNILYNDIVIKYKSANSIILYRIITTIYIYILPITPNINILIEAIIRLIIPYIIYVFLNLLYSKQQRITAIKSKRKDIAISIILCIIVANLVMLISCQFKYCALVIGSGSMTGTIDKGDIIIYKTYEQGQALEENEIIVFNINGRRIVHRIINKKDAIQGMQYYTKGDANSTQDDGYREEKDIIGIVKFKISKIGKITLSIRELFQ